MDLPRLPAVTEVNRLSARERDLDNLLLEELSSSANFRAWFLAQVSTLDIPAYTHVSVRKNEERHSEVGQTDLGMRLFADDDTVLALLLIENKVQSSFQDGQPERYQAEVAAARDRLGHRRAATVLVAPENNLHVRSGPGRAAFDADITIEAIASYMEQRAEQILREQADDTLATETASRLCNKAVLLSALLGRSSRQTTSLGPDPERLSFMGAYRAMASEALGRDFLITASGGGRKSTTMIFKPAKPIPGNLPVQYIRHDFGAKQEVSLVLSDFGARVASLVSVLASLPGAKAEAGKASRVEGKQPSVMVRMPSPALDVDVPPHEQQAALEGAFTRIKQMHDWVAQVGPTVPSQE